MKGRYTEITMGARNIAALFCAVVLSLTCIAQERPGDHVYRFRVEGINDPVAAKPLQAILWDLHFVNACYYIDECQCLKLSSSMVMTPGTFAELINDSGYSLRWPVHVSDGAIWSGPLPELDSR